MTMTIKLCLIVKFSVSQLTGAAHAKLQFPQKAILQICKKKILRPIYLHVVDLCEQYAIM